MKPEHAITLARFSLCMAAAAVQLSGCSSISTPAEADGSTRMPANDQTRVQALQQRVNTDRQLLSENNLLRAQVDVLRTKLNEMTSIVREALTLPPAVQSAPATVPAAPPAASPQSMTAPALPAYAYDTNVSGVVIRVFHPFARTEFEPSEQIAQALRTSLRTAEKIEVRGHTDSNVVNPIDKLIAVERAERARTWLINNGAEGSKIRTRHFAANNFLTENTTPQGRSMNRRVEIEIRNQQLTGKHVATSN